MAQLRAVALSAIFALILLTPYRAAKPYNVLDVGISLAHIVEGRNGLAEGQFPLRVAPWQWKGLGYPVFQFYSPLPYTLMSAADLVLNDPWLTMRLWLFLALTFCGWTVYLLMRRLIDSERIALLGVALYLTVPYFAVNLQARGAIAEVFGQALLPLCALTLWSLITRPDVRSVVGFAIALSLLVQTHLVSAVNFLLTVSVLIGIYWLKARPDWRRAIPLVLAGSLGLAIAGWYLVPVALASDGLIASLYVANPYDWRWLTPLRTILAPISVSPIPGDVPNAAGLHAAIGWTVLACFVLIAIRARRDRRPEHFAVAVMGFILFFLIWTPVNIWALLPKIVRIEQFPYRNLAQISWLALFAFAWGVAPFRPRLERSTILPLSLVLLSLAALSTFLYRRAGDMEADTWKSEPSFGYSDYMYLAREVPNDAVLLDGTPFLLAYDDGLMRLIERHWLYGRTLQEHRGAFLVIDGEIEPNPAVALPATLEALIDGEVAASYTVTANNFTWRLPLESLASKATTTGRVSLQFRSASTFVLPGDARKRGFKVRSARFHNPQLTGFLREQTASACRNSGPQKVCDFSVDKPTWIQLPVMHYPGLMSVTMNGKSLDARGSTAITDGRLTPLTAVQFPTGTHRIEARFVGSRLGDALTILSILATLVLWFRAREIRKFATTEPVEVGAPSARPARRTFLSRARPSRLQRSRK
jgi:hypothetical protein